MQEGRWQSVLEWGKSLIHGLCNMKDITMTLAGSERVLLDYPVTKVLKSIMLFRRAGGAVVEQDRN